MYVHMYKIHISKTCFTYVYNVNDVRFMIETIKTSNLFVNNKLISAYVHMYVHMNARGHLFQSQTNAYHFLNYGVCSGSSVVTSKVTRIM
jgi:hypothetical protein